MSKITQPKAQVPIGTVVIDGMPLDVQQHPEMVRFFNDLVRRIGGTDTASNSDLLAMAAEPIQTDSRAGELLRVVDELRNEVSSVRSDCDNLRRMLAEQETEVQMFRPMTDLRTRIEDIEGRFT